MKLYCACRTKQQKIDISIFPYNFVQVSLCYFKLHYHYDFYIGFVTILLCNFFPLHFLTFGSPCAIFCTFFFLSDYIIVLCFMHYDFYFS